jgi:hypothetical protein
MLQYLFSGGQLFVELIAMYGKQESLVLTIHLFFLTNQKT